MAAASLNFLSLTPKTLSVHNSSASSTAAPCLFTTLASIKPFPKLVLSVNYHARGTCSRFVRHVAVSSEVEEDEDEDEDDDFSGSGERSFSAELKLFVGNLPFNVDSAALADLFQQAGNVEMVEVIYDKITGRSRGFGFVTMSTIEEVEAAAQQFNGYEIQGRAMRVNFGPPPAKREDSFGSRGSRGGYGDGQRGGYSDGQRGGYNDRSRGGYGDGQRGGYGDGQRGSYGDGQRGGYGDGQRGGYGDKPRGGGYGERPRGGAGSDSSNRVYVGNLAWGVDNLALETLFKEQGKVTEARVVYDRESGRSRGFGFVTLGSPQEVKSAINSLDGIDLNGRAIRVSAAEARPSREY